MLKSMETTNLRYVPATTCGFHTTLLASPKEFWKSYFGDTVILLSFSEQHHFQSFQGRQLKFDPVQGWPVHPSYP